MKHIYFIILITLICSCSENKSIKPFSQTLENTHLEKKVIFGLPFDLDSLKVSWSDFITSGFRGKEDTKFFYKPKEKGFYGGYTFRIDHLEEEDKAGEPLIEGGYITIFSDKMPWLASDSTETFIMFKANKKGIPVYDNITIGTDVSLLNSRFGKPYRIIDNIVAYKDDINMLAAFELDNTNKVNRIYIGHLNEYFYEDFDKNLTELFKPKPYNHNPMQ